MDMKKQVKKNALDRPFRTVPVEAPIVAPPLMGLTNLYLSGMHSSLKAGDAVATLLVPGSFKQGCLWVSLCEGDTLFLTLLVNGQEVKSGVLISQGMNRLDVDLAFMEGDKVQVLVTGGNAREAWWGLRLMEGTI